MLSFEPIMAWGPASPKGDGSPKCWRTSPPHSPTRVLASASLPPTGHPHRSALFFIKVKGRGRLTIEQQISKLRAELKACFEPAGRQIEAELEIAPAVMLAG
ncbi:UNVERIFIED_ORG: hypothetical protein M2435_003466 [Rhizobium sophorae]|nr:hypothetical protein [Rhizobium sophorae]